MDVEEKISLVKRNAVEIITEEELRLLLETKKKPVVYCGYEPSGPLHLGHFTTITKLMDFEKAGFNVIVLLADVHALLNRKGDEKFIKAQVSAWKKTIKAIGLGAKIVLGSSFQFKKDYTLDVMKMSQNITIKRGLRSMQEVGRDMEHATISQMLYPLMQVEDIKFLGCDVSYGGLEQRKIHMLAREMSEVINHKPIIVHTPLITSLKGPGGKMSSSIPGSNISVLDSDEKVKSLLAKAYCPIKEVKDNPILQIAKLIILPNFGEILIERPEKYGGNISFDNFEELKKEYASGKLHPADLKKSVATYIIKLISPIRKNFESL